MAILSKIRERSVFLILIIGLALLAFVLDPSSIQSFFQANKINAVGEVDGETINRDEFANLIEAYKANSGSTSNQQAMNYAWDELVGDYIYKDQLGKAGVVVGEEDVWRAIVSLPFFKSNPSFQNEGGLFDEEKVKEYIANLKDNAVGATAGSSEYNVWQSWLSTEAGIRKDLEKTSYNDLVAAGLGASLKEGEREYAFNNNKVSSKYVYVPYASIKDSLITLTTADYNAYIESHSNEFQVEESRDINYVNFNIVASAEDKEAIKNEVAKYINDREEYSNAAKATITVKGLKNATDAALFLEESKSDLPNNESFLFENNVQSEIAEDVFSAKIGDVVGPYESVGYFKISKINALKKMPDSVKSRHIIIPFAGTSRSASAATKEAAKKSVDSIYKLVRNSSKKFSEVADAINSDGTKGKGGDIGWVTKDQAFSPNFDKDFAEFLFNNKKGTVRVVETKFGFHVIKIDDQTKYKDAVQLLTLARQISPSVETENEFYQQAESFASDVVNGEDVNELVKKNSYYLAPAIGLKKLDEYVPGLRGSQRQIVNWTFDEQTSINGVKRFDVENGYVVAILTNKTAKGLSPVNNVVNKIRPILINEKKAEMISKSMKGDDLEAVASANNTNVRTVTGVSLASPTISGVGAEPSVVGAMMGSKEGEMHTNLAGAKGVFAIQVSSFEVAPELPNYGVARTKLSNGLKARSSQIFSSLKSSYEIEDYRGDRY